MSKPVLVALFVLSVSSTVGCSSGGGGSKPPPSATTYTISGMARAAPATAFDGDVADPAAPVAHNDTAATAQTLPSVVTVGGHAGPTDVDVYRARLAAGQVVILDLADATGADLDLGIFDPADPTTPVALSAGTGAVETITVPVGADYLIVVVGADPPAPQGSTNYVLTLSRGAATSSAGALDATAEFLPGQVIVRFRDDLPLAAGVETVAARAASLGLTARGGGARRAMLMELPAGATARASALETNGVLGRTRGLLGAPIVNALEQERLDTVRLVKALRRRADVASADLNYVRRAMAVPNDTYYPLQWHYPMINLPQAWDVTTGTRAGAAGPVIVAVVDTGVLLTHPDLAGKLVPGYDFISDATLARDGNGRDADPTDPGTSPNPGQSSWHGTHVAGTIAAASNDGAGVAGVSWGARIMPLRVLGLNGAAGSSYDIMQAVRFAARLPNDSGTVPAQKADVVNLSLGGAGSSATEQADYDAVRAAGVIVVAAAGNDNTSQLLYPASYNGVISVSAVDMHQQRAPYSNYGTRVDVAAPGGDMTVDSDSNGRPDGVLSTVGDDSTGTLEMAWRFLQGTSMASPHVAGVVALMRAVCPSLSPDQLDGALTSGAITTDLGSAGRDDVFGNGLIDAFRAVQWASDPAHCAATTGTVTTTISATPARADFVPSGATAVTVTIAKLGNDAVTGVAVSGQPAWLIVTPVTLAAGIGTYRFTPSTAGLQNGVYSGSVTFTASPIAKSVVVPVTLQVGASPSSASNAGYLYLLLVDAATGTTVKQLSKSPTAGAYSFSFTEVPAGSYFIVGGTDSNNDDKICDAGESCGAYPSLAEPVAVSAATSPTNLSFQVGFTPAIGGASAGGGVAFAIPPAGLDRLPALKAPAVLP